MAAPYYLRLSSGIKDTGSGGGAGREYRQLKPGHGRVQCFGFGDGPGVHSVQYIQKRDQLHGLRTSPKALSAAARGYLAKEAYSDALDFFEKANDRDGIAEVKKVALGQGDSFLLFRLQRFDRKLVTEADWQAVASKAESLKKDSMAAFARKQLAPADDKGKTEGEKPLEEA